MTEPSPAAPKRPIAVTLIGALLVLWENMRELID